jgi:hypothetical protein
MSVDPEEPLVCKWCGCRIKHDDQRCPALDDGECRP